jgi:hypothetical protein
MKPIIMIAGERQSPVTQPVEGRVRGTLLIVAVAVPVALAGCGWFGGKSDDQAAKTSGPAASSDEVLKRDCADENWKKQNLGLWYSVCRQSMRW